MVDKTSGNLLRVLDWGEAGISTFGQNLHFIQNLTYRLDGEGWKPLEDFETLQSVISGVGKGIIASSTGLLLKTMGLKVTMIKIDPYVNVDAGTMAPREHGECFVLDDGGEVDLDLGNYERYLNITLTSEHSITTGKMYQHVIAGERAGYYLGKTVQVIPHLTNFIQEWIERVAKIPVDKTGEEPDVCVVELGGTIGDIENMSFAEALRQLRQKAGNNNFLHTHVSLIPIVNSEQKTKPTQQAIQIVRRTGLSPDLIACRCKDQLELATIQKIARYCQVEIEQVVVVPDVPSTYMVPAVLKTQGLIELMSKTFAINPHSTPLSASDRGAHIWQTWNLLTAPKQSHQTVVSIVIVGKYISFLDAYMSLVKALEHSAMACQRRLNLVMVNSEDLEPTARNSAPELYEKAWSHVHTANGILVPGGFGTRGTEGMIKVAKWARQEKVPYLGICLGMQVAVIEFARNECGLDQANSVELDKNTSHPVVVYMPEIDQKTMGGNMRLGLRATHFQPGTEWSKLRALYSAHPSSAAATLEDSERLTVHERHRHRYEVNPVYVESLAEKDLQFIGRDDTGKRMEILELRDHPWFVGVQYHPEYISKVLEPSRPILGFLAASSGCLEEVLGKLRLKNSNQVVII